MSTALIFWRQPLRMVGACTAETAAARLRALLSTSARFSAGERIVGRIDGMRFRIWKKTLFGASADVVQLEGLIEPGSDGVVVEGVFNYKAATKIQFIGFLVLGILIAASGGFQKLAGGAIANDVIAFGSTIALVTATWIVAADWMKGRQIDTLESSLRSILAAEPT
jgi:hypothetical protein